MSGDRMLLESQWRSVRAPPIAVPLSVVAVLAIVLVVVAAFLGGVLRWLVILGALGATGLAIVILSFRRAGFKRRHPPLLEDRLKRKDRVECASALVRRAREGSSYSQMVLRSRLREALVKRLAVRNATTVAQVEDLMDSGQADKVVDDPVLLAMLREAELDRKHWTDRVVHRRGESGKDYERSFIDIIERTEGL